MRKKRPTSVLVIAILHLVGGGLGIVLLICAGIGQLAQSSMAKTTTTTTKTGTASTQEMTARIQAEMEQKAPSSKTVQTAEMVASVILCIMLLAAGIGLLSMSNWARILSFVYAGFSIIQHLVSLIYFIAVLWPVMSSIFDAEAKVMTKGAPAGAPSAASTASIMKASAFGAVIFQTALIIYPIVVLIVLLMPSVGAAFAAKPVKSRRDADDEDDDDRPRRRSSPREEEDDEDDYDDRKGDRGSGRHRS